MFSHGPRCPREPPQLLRKIWSLRDCVNNIKLEIADREFTVPVSPSGCGKFTTLRMIAGLEEISGETVTSDGKVVNDVLPTDRAIAIVFQNYAL